MRSSLAAALLLAGCVGAVEPKNPGWPELDARVEAIDAALRMTKPPPQDGGACRLPLAQGLRIREVALYQTVKIPLYKDGAWVEPRIAPVVQGKQALLRVFVEPLAGYTVHDVRAVLQLVSGGITSELADERTISAASNDAQLGSTFGFALEARALAPDTVLSVTLLEAHCTSIAGAAADTQLPPALLGATAINPLEVVLVPVNLNGRLPVIDQQELTNMRAALLAYYPVPDVRLSVRAPLVWEQSVGAQDGAAWSDLLNALMRERANDAPTANTYYFGLMQPAPSLSQYCASSCRLGLAFQTNEVTPHAQVALGASFATEQTYETMVHELGHSHGRRHAPCGNVDGDGVDQSFPEPGGAIGTWGWDDRTNTLMAPSDKDIMGYCEPNWIGAYNYAAIAARSLSVNVKSLRLGSYESWQNVLLYEDGRARWGGLGENTEPAGEIIGADVLGANGAVIGQTEVVRIALSHGGASFLYVREASWFALRIGDRTLLRSEILPPL